ncbi:MAG: PSD1 and planctomycete cytochrome C domain-containing protein [Planctomycetota bacterium]|nr:PSD1 and planctomycete cytochrome C domain-containing protein [Planctomycetota bacterium]
MLRPVLTLALCSVPALAQGDLRFNRDVRPILSDRCFSCHGPDSTHRKAGLRLDTEEGSREALRAESREDSELWLRIVHEDPDERMPPASSGKELTAEEIEVLGRWIDEGARYEEHWAWVAPARPERPANRDAGWATQPIDDFVLAGLEAAGLAPSGDADAWTLVRRLHLDLTGLPPTPEEARAFVEDERPDRVARRVDALLTSPRHAERLATWWLDLVRFADTVGYHGDQEHSVEPYRDYVLKAFHENYPFDRFTREQLAGDLLPERTDEQWIASAYNRLLQTTHEGGAQPGEYLAKYAADRVRNVSQVWLGATMGCAECHDHKYDPYTQADFYRLAAFFADVDEDKGFGAPNTTPTKRPPQMDLPGPFAHQTEKRPVLVTVSVAPRPTRVLARGDWMDESGPLVDPGVPEVLPPLEGVDGRATRLDLANWLVRGEHPQTARVVVNRLWAMFFGRGLARDLGDNGSQGGWPTHPELLDWLAVELVDSGWDLRHVIRSIVTSSTYRQDSAPRADLAATDPGNALLGRQRSWRLEAEFVRDLALYASGLLVEQLGGDKGRPYQPAGYYAHLNFPPRKYKADEGAGQYRRGLYVHWQRMFLHPMLRAFDAPTREECTAERSTSNTPLQALTLLNDPTFVEAARVFGARISGWPGDDADRIERAFRTVVVRAPAADEVEVLAEILAEHRAEYRSDEAAARELLGIGLAATPESGTPAELAAWTSVARVLLNLHEGITRR